LSLQRPPTGGFFCSIKDLQTLAPSIVHEKVTPDKQLMNYRYKMIPTGWTARFWILLGAVMIVRLVYLAAFPCDLSGDETYYWEWGRRLSFGYFSKPPLIAWMMALADFCGGGTAYGIRAFAALFSCGATIATFYLGKLLYDGKVGFWSAAVTAAMPGSALLSIFMTIDAPLVCFWTAALYFFYVVTNGESAQKRALGAIGLILALGLGHLSKQIMWLFPPLCILYLIFDGKNGREKLKLPGLWLTFVLSYFFLIPTLLWNARHGWITFVHTGHHFQGDGLLSFPKNIGEFAGMQLGLLSPILAILVFGVAFAAVFSWRKLASRERFLTMLGAVPLAVMMLMTLRQRLNGNWAAAFYPAAIVLATGCALSGDKNKVFERWPFFRKWFNAGLWVAVGTTVFVYAMPFVLSNMGLVGSRWDAYARFRGWKDFAQSVEKTREMLPELDAPIIVVGHRYGASELAFYLPNQPRVYHWAKPEEIDSQYEIWGGFEKFASRNVFIISTVEGGYLPDSLRACLSGSSPKGIVMIDVGNGRKIKASLYWSGFIEFPATANKQKILSNRKGSE
jgi:hypothetical protein